MNNQQILEKAIRKAIDGGWLPYFAEFDNFLNKDTLVYQIYNADLQDVASVLFGADAKGYVAYAGQYRIPVLQLIFNHDFAKSLFGEDLLAFLYEDYTSNHSHMGGTLDYPYSEGAGMEYKVKAYLYHLQNMVISDDPIKYLGEHI